LGIKSFRQESIRSQPDSIQKSRTEYLIHAPPSTRKKFALLAWPQANGESIQTMLHLSFQKDDDQAEGRGGSLPRDMQIGMCHQKVSTYVEAINDMARGKGKELSKASKPRRR
jgi:hypothetical protein